MKAIFNGEVIGNTDKPVYIEQTYYFPADSVNPANLRKSAKTYTCPWKGDAVYFDVAAGGKTEKNAAWSYPDPKDKAASIKGHIAFDAAVDVVK